MLVYNPRPDFMKKSAQNSFLKNAWERMCRIERHVYRLLSHPSTCSDLITLDLSTSAYFTLAFAEVLKTCLHLHGHVDKSNYTCTSSYSLLIFCKMPCEVDPNQFFITLEFVQNKISEPRAYAIPTTALDL